jgi:hypothetical protein
MTGNASGAARTGQGGEQAMTSGQSIHWSRDRCLSEECVDYTRQGDHEACGRARGKNLEVVEWMQLLRPHFFLRESIAEEISGLR